MTLLSNKMVREVFDGETRRENCKVFPTYDYQLKRNNGSDVAGNLLRYVVSPYGSLYIENLSDPNELTFLPSYWLGATCGLLVM